ncbi:MAG: hypothetical protein NZM44_02540, partial [Candidatus Calescibacterium sp.]|nr:hypothetical protein [Candidatus Calescibacterium sp.]
MKVNFFYSYLFSSFYLLYGISICQPVYNYHLLHADNGLTQNSVSDVFKDSEGFLWIGTADGINRWDGLNFKYYYHNPKDPSSIGGLSYYIFHEDQNRNLWVAHDKGISVYNKYSDKFINSYINYKEAAIIGEYDQWLYIYSHHSILRININTFKTEVLLNTPDIMAHNDNTIFRHQRKFIRDAMFIKTASDIYCYNASSNSLSPFIHTPKNIYSGLIPKPFQDEYYCFSDDSVFIISYRNGEAYYITKPS